MLSESTVGNFKASLRGGVIEPRDQSYDTARKVYNAMIDRRPRLIARCADVADVITAGVDPRRRPQRRRIGRVR